MLANFFGKSNPANYIILFVVFIAYASGAIFGGYLEEAGLIKLISLVGGVSVLFFLFNLILTKIKLTLYNTYGFMFFVLWPPTLFILTVTVKYVKHLTVIRWIRYLLLQYVSVKLKHGAPFRKRWVIKHAH